MVLLNVLPRAAPLSGELGGDGGVCVLGRTPARIIGELLDVPAAKLRRMAYLTKDTMMAVELSLR